MENNKGGDDQQSGTRKNSSSPIATENNSPARGASDPNNNQGNPYKREPRPLIIWTAILAIGTVVLGCAAVWSDFLIRDQLVEVRKASIDTKNAVEATNRLADAARDQANIAKDTEQRQLRAYVGPIFNSFKLRPHIVDCEPSAPTTGVIEPNNVVCYQFKNYGLTPAISPRVCSDRDRDTAIFAIDINLQNTINNVIAQCRHDSGPRTATNWPGEARSGVGIINQRELNKIIATPRRDGVLFFMIKYEDVFGYRHTTYVCRDFVYWPPHSAGFTRCRIEVPQDD